MLLSLSVVNFKLLLSDLVEYKEKMARDKTVVMCGTA